MSSKTTEWRRRKFGTPADGRGRHSNKDRAERLAFVGAVAAQLIATGAATHYGLKTFGRRVPTSRERELKRELSLVMADGDAKETKRLLAAVAKESGKAVCGDVCPVWARPADDVWQAIESAPFNPDCLALAAAFVGKLVYVTRNSRLRGVAHSDLTPKRKPRKETCWQAIDGMNRKTASYWKSARKAEYWKAIAWLGGLLKKNGLDATPEMRRDSATVLRDDLADVMAGEPLKIPKIEMAVPQFARNLRKNSFAGGGKSEF